MRKAQAILTKTGDVISCPLLRELRVLKSSAILAMSVLHPEHTIHDLNKAYATAYPIVNRALGFISHKDAIEIVARHRKKLRI